MRGQELSMGETRGGQASCCPELFLADPHLRLGSFIVLLQDRNLEFSLGEIHPYSFRPWPLGADPEQSLRGHYPWISCSLLTVVASVRLVPVVD